MSDCPKCNLALSPGVVCTRLDCHFRPQSVRPVIARALSCRHLGPATGEAVECPGCPKARKVRIKLLGCSVHGTCTPQTAIEGHQCCQTCPDYAPPDEEVPPVRKVSWAYGVTTVPARREDLLPRTLASLRQAGFDRPRLFVDGTKDLISWEREFSLDATVRWPAVRTAGNWWLSLQELYYREPNVSRYAIFQDDFVCSRNLREYLERSPYPEKGYLNLYTFPENEELAGGRIGWFPSNQCGRGAVALVFSREAVITLLQSPHMAARPQDAQRGWKAIDGGIVTAMKEAGWREFCHFPSLVQHTGILSTTGNRPHPQAASFPGESFDLLTLLEARR